MPQQRCGILSCSSSRGFTIAVVVSLLLYSARGEAGQLPYVPYYADLRYPGQGPSYLIANQAPMFEKADQVRLQCQLLNLPCVENYRPGSTALNLPFFPLSTLSRLQQEFQQSLTSSMLPLFPYRQPEGVESSLFPSSLGGYNPMSPGGMGVAGLPQLQMPSEEELKRAQETLKETLKDIQSGVNILNSIVNTARNIIK
eukprot:Gregarina_sp_Pseudo_9__1878@NODE_2287_length_1059_cov_98_956863_g2105_i0_p1_GENE_NODE_2287_length_1059_cov_98_956863_g2105_i0NODE_2287_length_1059_cov_98_956863_g2105_i0_p1_ORF_typecomplete_len199_score15_38AIM5/PF17050_5/0_26_NODE_2287_length_1059_cov_98_956863_g2105_i0173769